jgi:hypothetical protein
MTIRRLAVLGSLVVVTLAIAGPATADDLSDYLEEVDLATYSGTRLIHTSWDGIERMGIVDVQQVEGMAMVSSGHSYLMVGDGRFHALGSPGAALEYVHASGVSVSSRYVLTEGDASTRLGRPVETMNITEDGTVRMRVVVDTVTGAPLETEVFDGTGNLFRYSAMVEFSESAPGLDDYQDNGDYEMMMPVDEALVPERVGHYQLVDVYGGPAGGQQAFYTDGLFTFSLFAIEGRSNIESIAADGRPWQVQGFDYTRLITPTEVWVLWNAPGSTYALVGDLPPDHLEAVLADLARPGQRNWFARMWDKVFG